MTPTNEEIGKRMIVWMVAFGTGLEAFAAAIIALLDGAGVAAGIWGTATALLVVIGANVETVKLFLGR